MRHGGLPVLYCFSTLGNRPQGVLCISTPTYSSTGINLIYKACYRVLCPPKSRVPLPRWAPQRCRWKAVLPTEPEQISVVQRMLQGHRHQELALPLQQLLVGVPSALRFLACSGV